MQDAFGVDKGLRLSLKALSPAARRAKEDAARASLDAKIFRARKVSKGLPSALRGEAKTAYGVLRQEAHRTGRKTAKLVARQKNDDTYFREEEEFQRITGAAHKAKAAPWKPDKVPDLEARHARTNFELASRAIRQRLEGQRVWRQAVKQGISTGQRQKRSALSKGVPKGLRAVARANAGDHDYYPTARAAAHTIGRGAAHVHRQALDTEKQMLKEYTRAGRWVKAKKLGHQKVGEMMIVSVGSAARKASRQALDRSEFFNMRVNTAKWKTGRGSPLARGRTGRRSNAGL